MTRRHETARGSRPVAASRRTRRIVVKLEYDGTQFVGWQAQSNGRSVQVVLESAIKESFRETVRVVGSGRTDSGVHASGQVAHFDLRHRLEASRVRDALNSRLPADVQVLRSVEAPPDFHARRDAVRRRYAYTLSDGAVRPVIDRRRIAWTPQELDAEAMQEAARAWLGKHDMSSFRAVKCQAESPVRTLDTVRVERVPGAAGCLSGDRTPILVTVEARSFLHNQVRIMVGTLIEIGRGAQPVAWAAEVLSARDRAAAGPTAPAEGLVLASVSYDGFEI